MNKSLKVFFTGLSNWFQYKNLRFMIKVTTWDFLTLWIYHFLVRENKEQLSLNGNHGDAAAQDDTEFDTCVLLSET